MKGQFPPLLKVLSRLAFWRLRVGNDLLALCAGALLPLAFSPLAIWPLAILSMFLLFWLWERATPRRAAWQGGLFGIGAFSTGIYWVYISLHYYGNAPAAFAVLTTLALVLLMALYPAAAGYLLARWMPYSGWCKWLLIAPALWAGLEWIRSWLFTGFPWLSLGYSQIDSLLGGLAPYLGIFGVSWAVALSASLLLLLIQSNWQKRLILTTLAVILWGGAWGLAQINWSKPQGEPLRISLIQGNVSQDRKWQPEQLQKTLQLYARLSLQVAEESDIVIWPETAIPMFYQDAENFIRAMAISARRSDTDYLVGVPSGSWETRVFYNGVVSFGNSHGFYYKRRLLPFGEYLPLRSLLNFFHRFVEIPMADFTPGREDQALLKAAGYPVGVSICFEAAFGSEIRKDLPRAKFLVNISNDAWFGNSLAPYQHLQIVRMRALETGRYLARATNTGITALLDERGRVLVSGEAFSTTVVQGMVQPMIGATPYVRMGDSAMVILMSTLIAVGLILGHIRES